MSITQDFRSIPLEKLIDTCKERKDEGYRLAQLCPKLERDDSITLIYTFIKESEMINYKVSGIKKGVTEVPSVTELFIAAFVFENEAHDLFGVNVVGNLIANFVVGALSHISPPRKNRAMRPGSKNVPL